MDETEAQRGYLSDALIIILYVSYLNVFCEPHLGLLVQNGVTSWSSEAFLWTQDSSLGFKTFSFFIFWQMKEPRPVCSYCSPFSSLFALSQFPWLSSFSDRKNNQSGWTRSCSSLRTTCRVWCFPTSTLSRLLSSGSVGIQLSTLCPSRILWRDTRDLTFWQWLVLFTFALRSWWSIRQILRYSTTCWNSRWFFCDIALSSTMQRIMLLSVLTLPSSTCIYVRAHVVRFESVSSFSCRNLCRVGAEGQCEVNQVEFRLLRDAGGWKHIFRSSESSTSVVTVLLGTKAVSWPKVSR